MEQITVEGVTITLSHEDVTETSWVGQQEMMERLLACWLVVGPKDLPLCPRLVGKPGVGKTTLAMAAAKILKKPLYIFQCTMDTRPEDLIVTPVISEGNKISYHASTLVTAMVKGGVCILDEGNRMSEKSWASLAPLLDHRRYVESIIAGTKIEAHPDFRCCVTMNDDTSTYELPDYIVSRIQPTIELSFPEREEELQILKYNLPFASEDLLQKTVDFLQKAHLNDLDCSTRDGIHILRYTLKRLQASPDLKTEDVWSDAVRAVLGYTPEEADKLAKRKQSNLQERRFSDLAEFFMDPEYFRQDPTNYSQEDFDDHLDQGTSQEHFNEHLDQDTLSNDLNDDTRNGDNSDLSDGFDSHLNRNDLSDENGNIPPENKDLNNLDSDPKKNNLSDENDNTPPENKE